MVMTVRFAPATGLFSISSGLDWSWHVATHVKLPVRSVSCEAGRASIEVESLVRAALSRMRMATPDS